MFRSGKNLIFLMAAPLVFTALVFSGFPVAQAAPTFNESPVVLSGKSITFQGTPSHSINWTSYDGYTLTAGTATLAGNADTVDGKHIGTTTAAKWCTTDGTTINCTENSPLSSFAEVDPTVSAWAKAATKPSYSFTEITSGSVAATTGYFSGDVGIGTSNPINGTLEVTGSIYTSAGLTTNASVQTPILQARSGNFINFKNYAGTSVMYMNGATSNVGIGTTDPQAKLDLNGTLQANSTVTFNLLGNGGTRLVTVDNSGTLGATTTLAGVTMPSGTLGQTLRYGASGWESTSTVFVLNGSNVGIGTTNPGYKLDVVGNTRTSGYGLYSSFVVGNTAGTALYNATVANGYIGFPSAGKIVIMNSNVGIGTTSPSTILHVQKDQNTNTTVRVENDTSGTAAQADFRAYNGSGDFFSLGVYSAGTTAYGAIAPRAAFNYGASPAGLVLMADNAAGVIKFATGGNAEKVRIDNQGLVGIGTTNPQAKLDLNGTLLTNSTVTFSLLGGGGMRLVTTDNSGTLGATTTLAGVTMPTGTLGQTLRYGASSWESTSTVFVTGGNVGIGTTNPAYLLEVNGAAKATSISLGSYILSTSGFYYSSSGKDLISVGAMAGGGAYPWIISSGNQSTNLGGYIGFNTDIADAMRIIANGNVGIGTTSPGTLLDVNGDIRGTELRLSGGGTAPAGSIFSNSNYGFLFTPLVAGNIGAFSFQNTTQTAALMTIQNGGNVGIGTTAPGGQLTLGLSANQNNLAIYTNINSSIFQTYAAINFPTTNAYKRILDIVAGGDGGSSAGSYIRFLTQGNNDAAPSSKMIIDPAGNVGIGTTNPQAKLDLNGTLLTNSTVTFSLLNNSGTKFVTVDSSGTLGATSTSGSSLPSGTLGQTLRYGASGWESTSTVFVTGSSVGIGTTDPAGYKLNVNGGSTAFINNTTTGNETSLIDYTLANTGAINSTIPIAFYLNFKESSTNTRLSNQVLRFIYTKTSSSTGEPLAFDAMAVFTPVFAASQTGQMYGLNFEGPVMSTGKTLSAYTALHLQAPSGAGTVTTNRSIVIDDSAGLMTVGNSGLIVAGNVGIGTTGSGYKLEVSGTSKATSIQLGGSSGPIMENWWEFGKDDGVTGTGIDMHGGSTYSDFTSRIYRTGGDNGTLSITNRGTGGMFIGNNESAPLYFQTAAATQMTILGGGNVGIGKSPSTNLDVLTSINAGSTVNGTSLCIAGDCKTAWSQVSGGLIDRMVYGVNGSGSNEASPTQNVYELAQYKSGFWDSNAASWTPTTDWYWGGTFAHTSNSGSYNYAGQLIFKNGSGGNGVYTRTISAGTPTGWSRMLSNTSDVTSSGNLQITGAGSHYISNGNVGIGTTTPGQQLEINKALTGNTGNYIQVTDQTFGTNIKIGNYYLSGNSSYAGVWLNQATPDTTNYAFLSDAAGGNTLFNAPSGKNIYFRIGNTDKMIILNGGNVGIGTTTPTTKLDIYTPSISANTNVLTLSTGSYGATNVEQRLRFWDTRSYDLGYIGSGFHTSGGGYVAFGTVNSSTQGLAATEKMRITNEGNVGIGTTNPTTTLYVNGDVTANAYYYSSDLNLKKNVQTLDNSLANILKLRGVSFDWKKDGKSSLGLIAQEVKKVYPELVGGAPGNLTIQYGNLVAPLIEAIKEQQTEINSLEARIKVLEKKKK